MAKSGNKKKPKVKRHFYSRFYNHATLCAKFQKRASMNTCPSSKTGLKNNPYSLKDQEPNTYEVGID